MTITVNKAALASYRNGEVTLPKQQNLSLTGVVFQDGDAKIILSSLPGQLDVMSGTRFLSIEALHEMKQRLFESTSLQSFAIRNNPQFLLFAVEMLHRKQVTKQLTELHLYSLSLTGRTAKLLIKGIKQTSQITFLTLFSTKYDERKTCANLMCSLENLEKFSLESKEEEVEEFFTLTRVFQQETANLRRLRLHAMNWEKTNGNSNSLRKQLWRPVLTLIEKTARIEKVYFAVNVVLKYYYTGEEVEYLTTVLSKSGVSQVHLYNFASRCM